MRQENRALAGAVPIALAALSALPWPVEADMGAVSQDRARELVRLVRQDCGSCHGLTLRGGLGPPLLPDALADKPADSLIATVLNGRPGTAMPPWRSFLNETDARWIVERLIVGFPEERTARP